MKTRDAEIVNGLNTTQLFETIDAIADKPSLARFQFRAKNEWVYGGENRSKIRYSNRLR